MLALDARMLGKAMIDPTSNNRPPIMKQSAMMRRWQEAEHPLLDGLGAGLFTPAGNKAKASGGGAAYALIRSAAAATTNRAHAAMKSATAICKQRSERKT